MLCYNIEFTTTFIALKNGENISPSAREQLLENGQWVGLVVLGSQRARKWQSVQNKNIANGINFQRQFARATETTETQGAYLPFLYHFYPFPISTLWACVFSSFVCFI